MLLVFTTIDGCFLGASVAVVQARDDLSEDLPNELLFHVLLCPQAALDNLLEVAALAVLHDDVNF